MNRANLHQGSFLSAGGASFFKEVPRDNKKYLGLKLSQ